MKEIFIMSKPPVKTLLPIKVRDLTTRGAQIPTGHFSAASSLVLSQDWAYVVADDEHHLGVFRLSDPLKPLEAFPIFSGHLPEDSQARKKIKPDLEGLLAIAPLRLIAVPSGSKKNRTQGRMIQLQDQSPGDSSTSPRTPVIQRTVALDFAPLYQKLGQLVPDLNIEGAVDTGTHIWLLQRGNQGTSPNHIIVLKRKQFLKKLLKDPPLDPIVIKPKLIDDIVELNLGRLDGLRLTVTDGTILSGGQVLLCAAAEDTESTYDDGKIIGSALVSLHPKKLKPATVYILKPRLKVEGVAFDPKTQSLWMVTDHDSRTHGAGLWHLPVSQLGI